MVSFGLRLISGLTRRDRYKNKDIRGEVGVDSILEGTERSRLRCYGHVKRIDNDRLPKRYLTAKKYLTWVPDQQRD